MKKIRLGVLGVGPRMRSLLSVYLGHEGVEIVALCDSFQRNLDKALLDEKRLAGVKTYLDYETMMSQSPMDALMITIDPYHQVEYACDAMNRGVHVMTEVPCAMTIEDCKSLVNSVEKTGCYYQLAEQTRFMHFITEWRRMYKDGLFGQMLLMEGEYLHYEKWDNYVDLDTGELLFSKESMECPSYGTYVESKKTNVSRRLGETWRYKCMQHPILYLPHELSPLLSVTEDAITHVSCMSTRSGSYMDGETLPNTRDLEVAVMRTRKGSILKLAAGFTTPHGPRRETGHHWYHVKGVHASAEWSRGSNDLPRLWTHTSGKWRDMEWKINDPDAPEAAKQSGHGGLDWYPINEFVNAIQNKRQPWMNVYRAVGTAAPAILAAQSAEQDGIMLQVPDFQKGRI